MQPGTATNSLRNPFMDTNGDLLVLDTRVVADSSMVDTIQKIEELGQERCNTFFQDRLVDCTTPLQDKITKANLPLFGRHAHQEKSRGQKHLKAMKRDRTLFSTLYIVCQVRQISMVDFFSHENQPYPPSLSEYGSMRSGTKADLLVCLEDLIPTHDTVNRQDVHMVILDGAANMNMIKPGKSDSFNDYISTIMGYIRSQFSGDVVRVDMVFDIYRMDSLKAGTRQKRGKGTRRRVEVKNPVSGNWQEFLRVDDNKTELFYPISERVVHENFPGLVIITRGEKVLSSTPCDLEGLMDCTHEEADTRMFVHATGGVQHGLKKILLRDFATDVEVISISLALNFCCQSLWLVFGAGNSFRFIDATTIAQSLGDDKCLALSSFHALTGCDVTSLFAGKGKRTAWSVWNAFEDATKMLRERWLKDHLEMRS